MAEFEEIESTAGERPEETDEESATERRERGPGFMRLISSLMRLRACSTSGPLRTGRPSR